jgi:hypothetical protein
MVNQGAWGALGAWGAWGAWGALGAWGAGVLVLAGCSSLPANRECAHVDRLLSGDAIRATYVECEGRVFAGDGTRATIEFEGGTRLKFERLGYNAFGPTAVNIIVTEASGLVPRIASCDGVSAPNFHRSGPLAHHFQPTLTDVSEALTRHREVFEEVEFWPQCPQYWEVQDKGGRQYRYCARKKDATEEPPRPEGCSGGG